MHPGPSREHPIFVMGLRSELVFSSVRTMAELVFCSVVMVALAMVT